MNKSLSSKNTLESINSQIALVIKGGKYTIGYKSVLNALLKNEAKLVIVSSSFSQLDKAVIEYYSLLSRIPLHHYAGDSVTLGLASGRKHSVGTIAVIECSDAKFDFSN